MSETNYYAETGRIIKELRQKQNMTRKQLADGICSVSYVCRIENGLRCPSSVILRQITNKLGVTPEYLFRSIESPTALHVKDIINQLVLCIERHDFKNIHKIISEKEKELDIRSIHDMQMIETYKYFCAAILDKNYEWGLDKLKSILELTYVKESTPTDIEFAIMTVYGFLLSLNNQRKEAYNYLINIKKYVKNIKALHSRVLIARFYMHLISSCLDISKLEEASEYLDYAINYCKANNTHVILPELYFLKSELYYLLKNENKFKLWYDESLMLHKSIKSSDDEYFNTFIQTRLNQMKTI